jgi:cyclohexyl-isocyanide hydratase
MTSAPFVIGIPVYQGVDLLDVAAPCEVFKWMGDGWKGGRAVKVYVVADTNGAVITRDGLQITPHKTFDQLQGVDLLWVPGGDLPALQQRMTDALFLGELRRLAERATYVTSVCEGALLLASAGLLDGFRATTHWAFIECLRAHRKITVVGGGTEPYPRFVVDDKNGRRKKGIRVTGGGVSSGLDEALQLVKMICGEDVAKAVQVSIQYFPVPPVSGTLPSKSPCPLS